tara:strand:+ start:96 stop:293 length:198 start_codon:yes stop_codon:yes gene_type:complete
MTKQEKLTRFDILESVMKMSTGSILRELEGGMKPGICESFDMRVAFTDRDKVIDLLINKRLEETV